MSAADNQRDEELAATLHDALKVAVREGLKDVHTATPGIVKSFDPKTQTATVQPALKRIWVEQGPIALPPCLDVPVKFPRGGRFVHTFPVSADDECLLCFSERAIDDWFQSGGLQEPSEFRMHDLSDAFAFVGFSSSPNAIKDFATDASEFRTLDGQTMFRLEQDFAIAGTPSGAELSIKGETYRRSEDLLFDAQNVFTTAMAAAFNAVATPADCVVALHAVGAAAAALISALTAFKAGTPTYLATKAKVG